MLGAQAQAGCAFTVRMSSDCPMNLFQQCRAGISSNGYISTLQHYALRLVLQTVS